MCVWNFETTDDGIMDITADQPLILIDPGVLEKLCISTDCTMSSNLVKGNELFLVTFGSMTQIDLKAELTRKGKVK